MQKVVLATGNPGKIEEMQKHLSDFGMEVMGQKTLNVPEADETGLSFVENAIIKARNAAKVTGFPAIADDSGICVDALNGAPGIYSARYSADIHGDDVIDSLNNQKLVAALQNVEPEKRTAYYYCALVYVRHADDPTPLICEGKWHGIIQNEPVGEGGFGYDPHFYVPNLEKTAAQLEKAEKNKISHRGQAMNELGRRLSSILES